MEQVVSKYLMHLNIPVSKKHCEKLILSHPDYPSLLSIADTLERLGIKHTVARIKKADLENLPIPFVLSLERGMGQLFLIRNKQDLEKYQSDLDEWKGVVLLAEETETIIDEENQEHLSKEKETRIGSVVLGLSVLLLLVTVLAQNFAWHYLLLFATAIAGTVLGYLLTAKDVGIRYTLVESFCNTGQKTNCDRVLNSGDATIFGRFKFSDAVLSYFTFQLIGSICWIPGINGATAFLSVLFVFSILSVPVVGYSIYIQGVKLQSWCRLCLLVSGVLLVQAALFWVMYAANNIGLGDVSNWSAGVVLLLIATGSLTFLLKTVIYEGNRAVGAEIAANRIKYSPDVFMYLLGREKQVDTTLFDRELLIGDPEAPVKILMAASLGCGPCKEGFEKTAQLVAAYPGKVSLAVRLRTGGGNNGNPSSSDTWLLGYWQQHIHGKADASARTEKLIRDWFEWMDMEKFTDLYPAEVNGDNDTTKHLGTQHSEWSEKAGIKGTPTFFINGWRLPKPYRIDDLMGMVLALTDHFKGTTQQQKDFAKDDTEELASSRSGRDKEG